MSNSSERIMEMLQDIHLELCAINTCLRGGLDKKPGLISEVITNKNEISQLKSWRVKQGRFIKRLIFGTIGSGGLLGVFFKLMNWI